MIVYNDEKKRRTAQTPSRPNLKNKLIDHLLGKGISGDVHISALRLLTNKEASMASEAKKIGLIARCALTTVKMKSVGVHFEQCLAFLSGCGVDIGTITHSR